MFLLTISRLHILLLSFPDVLRIGIEYRNFRRILGEREVLSKIFGDFIRI